MDSIHKKTLKKWAYCQTSLLETSDGMRYIEKTEWYDPANGRFRSFPYYSDEYEVYTSILSPLGIPHARMLEHIRTADANTFIMEYIEGLPCEDAPKPIHLYKAAEKIGEVYHLSSINLSRVEKNIIKVYTLTKEKAVHHIKASADVFDMQAVYPAVNFIYEKYKIKPLFINHFDMHLKNFIYHGDLMLIDWATMQISPFYTDLYVLFTQAEEVSASTDEIKRRYMKAAQIESIHDEDIYIGGILWNIVNIHWLLDLIGSDDVPFQEWAAELYGDLQKCIRLLCINL